jgi:hypothetical protein
MLAICGELQTGETKTNSASTIMLKRAMRLSDANFRRD